MRNAGLHGWGARRRIAAVVCAATVTVALCTAPTTAAAWTQFRHPTYGFYISYPQGWEVLSGEGKAAFAAVGPAANGVAAVRLGVVVATARIPAGATLEEADADLERTITQRGDIVRVLRKDRIDLRGVPALMIYIVRRNPSGVDLYQMVLIVAHNGRGYAIVGVTAAGSTSLSEETRLLQSLILTFQPR
jgi:predicted Zn-dependent protease